MLELQFIWHQKVNFDKIILIHVYTYNIILVLSREKYSDKADVYSFGILLLEIITDIPPYSIGEMGKLSNAMV